MTLPLFPIDLYLLPEGIGKLKIFEPRYLRLVKLALAEPKNSFGLCMRINNDLCKFGTRVAITDFDRLTDGSLSITIQGIEKFIIDHHWKGKDGLRFGEVKMIPNWHKTDIEGEDRHIAESLKAIFQEYPEYAYHYPSPNFQDMTWICQRWLEILPLEINQKQWFMSRLDHTDALFFLHDVIEQALKES